MAAGQRGLKQGPGIEPLLERLQGQIDWYDRKAKSNQRAYKVSKILIVALAILIPVLAEYVHIPHFEGPRFSSASPPAPSCCSKGSRS